MRPQDYLFAVAISLVLSACLFWGASKAIDHKESSNVREVFVGGETIGTIHLFPLTRAGGLQIYFQPVNGDLSLITKYGLSWWQVVDRRGMKGYPRIDMENQMAKGAGDDTDPAYYTREELSNENLKRRIFRDQKWWILDFPDVENGARFETWLVRQQGKSVERVVSIEWGFDATGGRITSYQYPQFIESSRYELAGLLSKSGFGEGWVEAK